MMFKSQERRDSQRDSYSITFPSSLTADAVKAWLGSITGTLIQGGIGPMSRSSVVFETWASASGITHTLQVPRYGADHITSQLRTHGQGIITSKSEPSSLVEWTAGVELGLSNQFHQLRITHHKDVAASLLGSLKGLQGDEQVLIQWVVSPATGKTPSPSVSANASAELISDMKKKLSEPNLLAVGRVVAKADNHARATKLVLGVEAALASANGAYTYFKPTGRPSKIAQAANLAKTPFLFPAQFTISELAAVIGWPIDLPFVSGLIRQTSPQIMATADVAIEGRVLGMSTFADHQRAIALPYEHATRHMVVTGGSGTGKTAFLVNCFAQDVTQGYGAIVMDAGDSQSSETMFSGALQSIPPSRVEDVIVIDVANESSYPVGFNVFEQTDPRTIADQLVHLFQSLYSDMSGVWLSQLLYHGVYTLAEHGGLSFVDLGTLLNPETADEKEWAEYIIGEVKDPNVSEWWSRWQSLDKSKKQTRLEPLYNRIWQVTSRPEIINIIGQSNSTFSIADVLAENKILLINLAGISTDTAQIIGTMFMNAIWTAARRSEPKKANFLYLDEFQVMTSNTSIKLDDLLSRARKHNLGLAMATQYFDTKVPQDVKSAAINNGKTKVIFRVGSNEARLWNAEFEQSVDVQDFRRLNNYEALVRIASATGEADVTMATLPPRAPIGTEGTVREKSRQQYGRSLSAVIKERQVRRSAPEGASKKRRPPVGFLEW